MKRFSNFVFTAGIFFVTMLFTSCFDYVQGISYKDGQYQVYHKITMSKVLSSMQSAYGYEDFSDDAVDQFEAYKQYLPEGARINDVDTDLEEGFESRFFVSPDSTDAVGKGFLPTSKGRKIYVPLTIGKMIEPGSLEGEMDDDERAMANIFLSSAKCRVLISKKIVPSVGKVYFEGTDGNSCTLDFYDYGDSFCVEIPFALLVEETNLKFERIVIEKGSEK